MEGLVRLEHGLVDLVREEVRLADGQVRRLTTKEADALRYLEAHRGEVVRRETLHTDVWGYSPEVASRAVDNTIRRLRQKIEPDPAAPRHILTVHGEGYRFVADAPPRGSPPTVGVTGARPAKAPRGATVLEASSFHGRARELAILDEQLALGGLVTLRGPGGVGKTRLAQEILRRRAGWFVDLSGLPPGADVGSMLAQALQVKPDRIASTLRFATPRVVVLDNCEQVLDSARRWAIELMATAPQHAFLATSRHALDVPGERVVDVPPLSRDDAVELLSARASTGAGRDRPFLVRLADRLDGLPLAMELAAGRLGVLGPADLLERLDRSLDVLARADRKGQHATLWATVDWSWRLLSASAQVALSRCTVFQGPFRASAAEAVVTPLPPGGGGVLDVLDELRRSSMLSVTAIRGGRAVLQMLTAIRLFAREHLAADDPARERHARWCAALPRWRRRTEHDNLLAAFDWAVENGPPELALALAEGLAEGFRAVGPPDRWLRTVDAAVRLPHLGPLQRVQATLLRLEARQATGMSEGVGELEALAAGPADPDVRARIELVQARIHRSRGALDEAVAAYRRGLEVVDDPWTEGRLQFDLGGLSADAHDHDGALASYQAALARFEEVGDVDLARRTELHLAMLLSERGRLDAGRARSLRVLRHAIEVGDTRGEGVVRDHLALVEIEVRDVDAALEHLDAARECHRIVGDRRFEAYNHLLRATLHQDRRELDRLEAEARAAVAGFADVGDRTFGALARARLGVARALRGEADGAAAEIAAATDALQAARAHWFRRGVEVLEGFVDLARGERRAARARLTGDDRHAPTSFVRLAARQLQHALE